MNGSGYLALSADPIEAEGGPGVHDDHHDASETLLLNGGSSRSTPCGGSVTVHSDGHGYMYSYGPSGLAGLIHNYYALGCAVFGMSFNNFLETMLIIEITASIGGLTFGYDQGMCFNHLLWIHI